MNVLITGGAGFVGSHVVKAFLQLQEGRVIIWDNLSTGSLKAVQRLQAWSKKYFGIERVQFIHADLRQVHLLSDVLRSHEIKAILHFAAHIIVPESVSYPERYFDNNTAVTAQLLRVAIQEGIERFVFSSTAAVYGEPYRIPVSEDEPTQPVNPYGLSKLMSERILQEIAKAHKGFRWVVLRYFNVAGADPDGLLGQEFPQATHLIKVAAECAVGKRSVLYVYGDDYPTPDGTGVRDYIHVSDLARAHILALNYLEHNEGGIFNCGYGRGFSVRQVIEAMKRVSGKNFEVQVTRRRPGDPAVLIADNRKIQQFLGWKPQYDDLDFICQTAFEWEKKSLSL